MVPLCFPYLHHYPTAEATEVKGFDSLSCSSSTNVYRQREAVPDRLLDSIPGKMGKFPLRQCDAQRAFSQNRKERNNPVASGYFSFGTAFREEWEKWSWQ